MPDSVLPRVKRNAMLFLVLAGGAMWIPVAKALFGRSPGFLRDLQRPDAAARAATACRMNKALQPTSRAREGVTGEPYTRGSRLSTSR